MQKYNVSRTSSQTEGYSVDMTRSMQEMESSVSVRFTPMYMYIHVLDVYCEFIIIDTVHTYCLVIQIVASLPTLH